MVNIQPQPTPPNPSIGSQHNPQPEPAPIMSHQLTWLITGCSSGFGECLTHSILARGDRIIATTRGPTSRLASLEAAGAAVFSLDVTASQAELDAKIQEALKIYDGIDVLVNNAGYIEAGLIEDITCVFFDSRVAIVITQSSMVC